MIALETIMLGVAVLVIISVLASKISHRLSLPALLLFLFIGMLAGSEGIGGIQFDDPFAAQSLGVIALTFILFAGGLDTPVSEVRSVLASGALLATLGVLITAGIVGLLCIVLLGFSPETAFLVAAITSSTDAAAVFSVLRSQKVGLKGNAKPLLEFESASNDPMAIFLTTSIIELVQHTQMPVTDWLIFVVRQMVIGVVLGYVLGYVTGKVMNKLHLEADGLYSVFTIAVVLFIYGFTATLGGSGFLAVYIAGLVLAMQNFIHIRSLVRFHDAVAWLMQIALFVVLGLQGFPSRLLPIDGTGIVVALILMFIGRPISVFLLLALSKFDFREKLMISWVGLRGAAPIVLATFPLLAGIAEADLIFNIVFFVVLVSVLLQGSTLVSVAKRLGVTTPLVPKPQYPFELVSNSNIKNELVEIAVSADSPAVDQQIVNLDLPKNSLIVLIARGQEIVVPSGNTTIHAGDILLVLADKPSLETIRAYIASSTNGANTASATT